MKTILIIDGDILSFRCAAANETRSIRVTHKVTGQQTEHAHRTAFREHIRGSFEESEFDIEDVQTCEDLSHAYHAINTCIEAWMKKCEADSYEIYISGEGNFRDELPLPSRYKGTREGNIRPVQLKECREYLVKRHGAIPVDGMEADDRLAHRAYEGFKQGTKNIVISLDKDSYGVDSWLYNWTKMDKPERIKGFGEIELDEDKKLRGKGRKWFYAQWVMGDPVDAFKPSEIAKKKFGDVACCNLLKDCNDDKSAVQAVYNQYKKWYPQPVTYTAWDGTEHTKDVVEIMDMYAACAHMKRFDNDVFDTRKLLTKLEIEL
jgi:hypothetical protein